MKCFEHQNAESIGICNYCGKGLCKDCFVVVDDKKLSCKGVCEEKNKRILSLEEKSEKSYSAVNKNWYIAPLFNLVIGILFSYYGYTIMHKTMLFVFMGLAFIFFGVLSLYRGYMFKQSINKLK